MFCAGVIVNNKGEMKGSAITGKSFPQSKKLKESQEVHKTYLKIHPHKKFSFLIFRPCGQGVRRPLAEDRFQCELHLLSCNNRAVYFELIS